MPVVSIIVPCYNEEATIGLLLSAIERQTYPCEQMEVILADGMSNDATRQQVAAFVLAHPALAVRLVDNPKRIIPAGLNCALAVAQGEIVVRLDAHSMPAEDYVARCVAALVGGMGDNVGGVWDIRPGRGNWIARSIAAAAAHPLGVGDASYRYASQAALVDTVPFGAFYRRLFEEIGYFDETLLTNEDYEFNARLRAKGGRVWLDPAIRSVYFARPSLAALSRQYWRYGFWKRQMLRRYPATLRWRQAIPPVFVLSLIVLLLGAPWWWLARLALGLEVCVYMAALVAGAFSLAVRHRDVTMLIGVPLAIATMHLSWGTGFLWGLLSSKPKG